MKTNSILSIKDTTVIKAIGILLIICHNFLHWIAPMLGENEFSYNKEFSNNFINSLKSNPLNFLQDILAFAGHYGLQLFIFISGYGLTVRYASTIINYKSFVRTRITKLYPVFTIALLGLFVYKFIIFRVEFNSYVIVDFILRYSLLANLVPKQVFVLNGPFWFYSMIVQLYLLFPLLLNIQKKKTVFLAAIAFLALVTVFVYNKQLSSINFSLFYNFVGHLPVFIFGIIYAFKYKIINKHLKWFSVISVLVLILSMYNMYFWYLSNLAFLILFLLVYLYFKKFQFPKPLTRFVLFTGGLSYYIFAVHGFLRAPWIGFANKSDSHINHYLYLLVFIIVTYLVAIITREIERCYFSIVTKYKLRKSNTNNSP